MRKISFLLIVAFVMACSPAKAEKTLCGWFYNPTPANAYLIDKEATWVISSQSGELGHEAEGDWPVIESNDWVHTNGGSYGYGCACMTVTVIPVRQDQYNNPLIGRIISSEPKKLEECRRDLADKEPITDAP